MKKLLKAYGFTNEREYHEMIIESVINGQRTQAKEQFKALPKEYRKAFINFNIGQETGLSQSDLATFVTLI